MHVKHQAIFAHLIYLTTFCITRCLSSVWQNYYYKILLCVIHCCKTENLLLDITDH